MATKSQPWYINVVAAMITAAIPTFVSAWVFNAPSWGQFSLFVILYAIYIMETR